VVLAVASVLGHVLGMAASGVGGVWFVMEALNAPGPMWSRIVFAAAGMLLGVVGLGLGLQGIGRFVIWVRDDEYAIHLARQADRLNLPTNPEAYGQGKWVPVSVGHSVLQAQMLVAVLDQHGIPAWTDTPPIYGSLSPKYGGGARVLVPEPRLADARGLIEAHTGSGEASLPAEDGPPKPSARRRVAGILLLLFAAPALLAAVAVTWHVARGWRLDLFGAVALCLFWAVGLGALVVGVRALRSPGRRQDANRYG